MPLLNENMNIVDYYVTRCQDKTWYDRYYQCGAKGDGSIFKCFSTNYRDLNSFIYYFREFDKNYKDKPKSEWERYEVNDEVKAKQYVVNLRQSSLFLCEKDEAGEIVYRLTERGKKFELMLDSGFNKNETKLLIFLFIVNSGFLLTPKYILKQSKMLWDKWADYEIQTQDLRQQIKEIVQDYDGRFTTDFFKYDVVWYLSFYSDDSFLKLYKDAEQKALDLLHETTINDYDRKNKANVLAYKFKSTNFSAKTLIDSLIMLYLSESILSVVDRGYGFHEFYRKLINEYNEMLEINKTKVLNFISNNEDVFEVIYYDATSSEDDFTERYIPPYQSKIDLVEPIVTKKIDTTSIEGIQKLDTVRNTLKQLAKEKTKYRCALEPLNNCRYFISKEENKNYLEIHHLIPREFAGEQDVTIEFVDNYIPLCPHCHRMIHHGTDEVRKAMISFLFHQREDALRENGLDVNIETLYKYYKIDD